MKIVNPRTPKLAGLALAVFAGLAGTGCRPSSESGPAEASQTPTAESPAPARSGPLLSAHRGGPVQMPENTLPAFQAAIELGFDILEFDMNLTADDQVVLHHDVKVNPEICRPDPADPAPYAPFRQLTLAQAQSFDCGSNPPAAFPTQTSVPGTRMPSLEQFLEAFKSSNVVLFGETKMPKGADIDSVDPELFVTRISEAVRRHGLEERFILQSGDYRTIDAMHRVNRKIRTCLLRMGEAKPDFVGMAQRHHASCVVMRLDYGDASDIKKLRDAGITVYSDVADQEEQWQQYLNLGVDAILTNDPVALLNYLQAKGIRQP